MPRYNNSEIYSKRYGKDKLKNYLGTTTYTKVPERNSDQYFIAQDGDRCDNLANNFYGNPNMWWFIARVNNLNTMNIPAGTKLRIPINTQDAKGF
tara:strand:- start:2861 stop:3145 length:285 start_codon:yes stop_codon:yes gene_type:complete